MLCENTYPKAYLNECRAKVEAQVSAYRALLAAAKKSVADKAVADFEPHYFNNLLLALDAHFVNRARGKELKDGNPLNEARMLCNALMNNHGVLAADKTIKYDPATSVLKYGIGEPVRLTEDAFVRVATAYLDEIAKKYR